MDLLATRINILREGPKIGGFPGAMARKESYAHIEDAPSERSIGSIAAYAPKIFNRTSIMGLLALAVIALLAIPGIPARSARPSARRSGLRKEVIQEWAGPTSKDQVLPLDEWAKVFKVVDDMDAPLTKRRYYQYSHHYEFVPKKAKFEDLVKWQQRHLCPPLSLGTEIMGDADLPRQRDVPSAGDCQRSCTQTPGCVAFTWVRAEGDDHQTCFRRLSKRRYWSPEPRQKDGLVSGLPCSVTAHPVEEWPKQEMDYFRLPKPPASPPERPVGGTRILCIAVCLPFTKEQDLLIMQYRYGIGIFACDNYAIYSSLSMELVPGVNTRRVSSTLMGELGGSFMTVLNLGAFMMVWKQVLSDAEYLNHDWILKVDPDTVFLVNRLRPILKSYGAQMERSGMYLNNCKDGLHGPLEVFSRGALMSLAATSEHCAAKLDGGTECTKDCDKYWDLNYKKQCNGPCTGWWGEDIWSDQCLYQFTDAKRVFEPRLLLEDHCDPKPGWRDCSDSEVVAFHPFKKPEEYQTCFERASGMKIHQ